MKANTELNKEHSTSTRIKFTPVTVVLLLLGALVTGAVGGLIAFIALSFRPPQTTPMSTAPTMTTGSISTAITAATPVTVAVTTTGTKQSSRSALGSGIIIDPEGHILTTTQVLGDRTQVVVVYYDGTTAQGTLVGKDNDTGLAVLQVNKTLPTQPNFGDPANIHIGDQVVALGTSDTDMKRTVDQGIVNVVSYKASITKDQSVDNLIESNAKPPEGGIGGPLVDLHGEILGITLAYSGNNDQWSLVLPINTARDIVQRITTNGAGQRASLGIQYQTVTPQIAQMRNLSQSGALVTAVYPNSPAQEAGLRPGDLIIALDDKVVNDKQTFDSLLAAHQPGQKIKLQVVRGKKVIDITATLSSKPPVRQTSVPNQSS